jgi:hypothetical protein
MITLPILLGYIVAFVSGGLAGALITRYFVLDDRRIKKITLKGVKDEMLSIVPIIRNGKQYANLAYKEFVLINKTEQDFPSLELFIEFDPESEILTEETFSALGKNRCDKTISKPNEYCYKIINFNRNHTVTFKFEVAGITKNFFSVVPNTLGVELQVISLKAVDRPSISPSKHVSKTAMVR